MYCNWNKFSKEEIKVAVKQFKMCSKPIAVNKLEINTSWLLHSIQSTMSPSEIKMTTNVGEYLGNWKNFTLPIEVYTSVEIMEIILVASQINRNRITCDSSLLLMFMTQQALFPITNKLAIHTHWCYIHSSWLTC